MNKHLSEIYLKKNQFVYVYTKGHQGNYNTISQHAIYYTTRLDFFNLLNLFTVSIFSVPRAAFENKTFEQLLTHSHDHLPS